jgi:hypothetical protein
LAHFLPRLLKIAFLLNGKKTGRAGLIIVAGKKSHYLNKLLLLCVLNLVINQNQKRKKERKVNQPFCRSFL